MITSRENPLVKRCRRLQASAKARREEGLFLAEGTRLCREALDSGLRTEVILATPEALAREPWLGERGEVLEITPEVAAAIADTKSPQGVFCLCAIPKEPLFAIRPEGRYLLLDGLQDPGNLGTILRAGEGAGITGVIMDQNTADIYNPKVIRSTMGSIFRVPFLYTDDLPETLQVLKSQGIRLFAAHLDGEGAYDQEVYRKDTGFLIGNESRGLSHETAVLADRLIKIPMAGQVESLNAAIASSILMFEAARQRRNA